jgi:hypothetical protein
VKRDRDTVAVQVEFGHRVAAVLGSLLQVAAKLTSLAYAIGVDGETDCERDGCGANCAVWAVSWAAGYSGTASA